MRIHKNFTLLHVYSLSKFLRQAGILEAEFFVMLHRELMYRTGTCLHLHDFIVFSKNVIFLLMFRLVNGVLENELKTIHAFRKVSGRIRCYRRKSSDSGMNNIYLFASHNHYLKLVNQAEPCTNFDGGFSAGKNIFNTNKTNYRDC